MREDRRVQRLKRVMLIAVLFLLGAVVVVRATTAFTRVGRDPLIATPADYDLDFVDVRFSARDGVLLSGWFVPAPQDRGRAVILVHGLLRNRADKEVGLLAIAAALHRRGFSVLLFDLRAHGQSGGAAIGFGWLEWVDVLGAIEHLEQRGYDRRRVGVIGYSTGGAAALIAAARDQRPGALILDSVYVSPIELFPGRSVFVFPLMLLAQISVGAPPGDHSVTAVARSVDPTSVFLIHGLRDDIVHPDNMERLAAALPGAELWRVRGAAHVKSFFHDPFEYIERVVTFLDSRLSN